MNCLRTRTTKVHMEKQRNDIVAHLDMYQNHHDNTRQRQDKDETKTRQRQDNNAAIARHY
jgi:hypothetical protein